MSSAGTHAREEIRSATDLVKELVKTARTIRLYDERHPALERVVGQLQMRWEAATVAGPVTLAFTPREVLFEGEAVHRPEGTRDIVPTVLHDDGIVGLVFHSGVTAGEVRRVASILASDPEADFSTLFWEADLRSTQALVDEEDGEAVPDDPEDLQREIAEMGDDSDPDSWPTGLDGESPEDSEPAMAATGPDGNQDLYELTESEHAEIEALVANDTAVETVRHALRVAHALTREPLSADEGEQLERVLRLLVTQTCRAGDLDGTAEALSRAARLAEAGGDRERQLAESTSAAFLEPGNLDALFRRLDEEEFLCARLLGDLLARLGPGAAEGAVEWLLKTPHETIAAQSMRLLGDAAGTAIVERYGTATPEERARLVPALLEMATSTTLTVAAEAFDLLSEEQRLALMRAMDRCDDPEARTALRLGLLDESLAVRRAAASAMRPADAGGLAELLAGLFERAAFDDQTEEEARDFFEMVARVGDAAVAEVLAAQCRFRGLTRAFVRVSPLQELCLRSLRRMRDAGARKVASRLRASAPKAVRELLENPYGI